MTITRRIITTSLACAVLLSLAPGSKAGETVPDWVKPALKWMVDNGHMTRSSFSANAYMTRKRFKRLMGSVFGRGYSRTDGYVTAHEVDRALVRVLGKASVARHIADLRSPDGWDPKLTKVHGFETVAREMGLRHDRPTTEEAYEAYPWERMRQADIVWGVWRAKTSPSTWGADTLATFKLSNYSARRRKVVKYALSHLGMPYVWAGEWSRKTPPGYPYGAQPHGGFDCSGLAWYVLKSRTSSYDPINRPYAGWSLAERSSSEMAKATPRKISYSNLVAGDLVFFSADGTKAKASSIYHAGLYLGKGWMVHSSGSRAGVSIGSLAPGSWWKSQFAWGRRVIGS